MRTSIQTILTKALFKIALLIPLVIALTACGSDNRAPVIDIEPDETLHTANAWVAGPGGDEYDSWEYNAVERPLISINRVDDLCIFDNGLVRVVDMVNEKDEAWMALPSPRPANQVDDETYAAYSFECGESPYNDHRKVMDGEYIWTYSNVNDAMFYGNLVHKTYVKYLGEAPLNDKIRIRVHYGSRSSQFAFWDGAYANFSDAIPFFYSTLSLDSVAHEIAHGVLNRISKLDGFDQSLSADARTVHEAFSDISALMAKYEYTGHTDNWIHSEKLYGYSRQLNKIKTEYNAIASMLDYDKAGENYYLRIGMLTYPFYVMSNEWNIETAYSIYVGAARHCWVPSTTLTQAAECIQLEAENKGLSTQVVSDAFKTVKIKLFDEGVLSHFVAVITGLDVNVSDTSESTTAVTSWHWDFGDGTQSSEQNPEHSYAQAGTYVVRLTVTDQSEDSDFFERTLVVSEPLVSIASTL